uniref:Ig-like domain-containing protein n=1 Tax=Neogobius melanostomus TaxID=47308 RepID=A0A8C6TZ46_9GOBI
MKERLHSICIEVMGGHSNTFRCVFNSTDPNDIQYIISGWFNKLELFRFDSKLGRFVGYTEFGVKVAQNANNNTAYLEQLRHDKYRVCVYNIDFWYNCILSKSVEPYGVIHTTPSGGSERVLVCSVYGFYPKDITVTWTNNNQQITTGVINSETMPDRDWTYQLHTHLEYSPISYFDRSGDQISCVVEHISLKEPIVLDYVAIGASGLVLGLVLSLAGFIYYRHKSRGQRSHTQI